MIGYIRSYRDYAKIQPLIRHAYRGPANQQTRIANVARATMLTGSIPVAGATYYSMIYTQPAQVFKSPTPVNQKGLGTTSSGVYSFPSSRFTGAQGALIPYMPPRMPGAL